MATLKPQSNRPLCSNTVIGTLANDGWAVTFGTARRGLGGLGPRPVPSSLYLARPSTAVPTSYYLIWHYNCLWTLKGCLQFIATQLNCWTQTELNWSSWTSYSQVSRVFVYDVTTYKLSQLLFTLSSWVQLSSVQLSWVELCHYKRALKG